MNAKVKEFIDIYQKVDKEFLKLQNDICHKEAEKCFGENYCNLTINKCSEEEFVKWWNKNKEISYNSYFYEIACYVWDIE
jgi:predicted CoA-binding protein